MRRWSWDTLLGYTRMSPKLARRKSLTVVAAIPDQAIGMRGLAVDPATYDLQENCPVIFANTICLGSGRTGRMRVTFYDSSERAA